MLRDALASPRLRRSLRDVALTARDLAAGLQRESYRAAVARELGLVPDAVRKILPWLVLARDEGTWTLARKVREHATRTPHGLALEMGDERLTWAEFQAKIERAARVLRDLGVARGEVLAIMGHNSPMYVALVLAATHVGATAALINSRLEGAPLSHAILSSRCRLALVERELVDAARARADLSDKVRIVEFGEGELDERMAKAPSAPTRPADVKSGEDFVYIYTSGTTGLPKPCRVSHAKAVIGGIALGTAVWSFRPTDKLYCVLPLYHSSALLIGFSSAIMTGTPIALRRSFSARAFFSDVRRYHATATLYIGELCRYLLASPVSPDEAHGSLRIAVGNGLRADLWDAFQERFGIEDVREFYGATEAPGILLNFTGRKGSVGRMPGRRLSSLRVIRYDVDSDTHPRGADGLCIECGPGEVGELVVVLRDRALTPLGEFRGYTDDEATRRKLLTDVFSRGDRVYRSGDLLRYDEDDCFYFVDRIGDTFRFKGENVSTAEVAEVLGRTPGVAQCAVSSIALPGVDGRAGVAVVVCDALPVDAFERSARELPDYARPWLVKVTQSIETTATFKILRQRIDLEAVLDEKERFWVKDGERYRPLDTQAAAALRAGTYRA